jgi:glutathione S-transferase
MIEAALPKVEPCLAQVEKALPADGHLAGGMFSMADMTLLPIVYYLARMPDTGPILKAMPKLTAYLARHVERASVQATIPPPITELPPRT